MLQRTALGFGSVALTSMLQADNPLVARQPYFRPRAKRVIFLFMKGGPAHMDTFEYKPLLQRDHGKPLPFAKPKVTFAQTGNLLASPWKFKPYGQCGHLVSELFPNVARHVDDICFLHGTHGTNPAHGGALLKLHTGADNFVRPSMGAWVSYGLGTENANLPAFVTICPTLAHGGVNNWGSAFLPAHYAGTPIGNASVKAKDAKVHHIKNPKWTPGQQRTQLDYLKQLNQDHLGGTPNPVLESRINSFELAYRMQTAMPEIQDISGETEATRKLYGISEKETDNFGRRCLMARRLVERGVRFVQIYPKGQMWDNHANIKTSLPAACKQSDQPTSALLRDLRQRGLIDDVLVLWGGEFGRLPMAQGDYAKAGRDHGPSGFTNWMAGGGVKGGTVYGETDDIGYGAVKDRVSIQDWHATILHQLGIDHEKLFFDRNGLHEKLTHTHPTRVVKEILA